MPPADDPVASCLAAVRSSSQAERAAQLKAMLAQTEVSTRAGDTEPSQYVQSRLQRRPTATELEHLSA